MENYPEIVIPDIDDVLNSKNDEAKIGGIYLSSLKSKVENILEKTKELTEPDNDLSRQAYETIITFSRWLEAMKLDILTVKKILVNLRTQVQTKKEADVSLDEKQL